MSGLQIDANNNLINAGYIEFSEQAAPANPADGKGRLYQKTRSLNLFWKPNSAGPEIDLTALGSGSGFGTGPFTPALYQIGFGGAATTAPSPRIQATDAANGNIFFNLVDDNPIGTLFNTISTDTATNFINELGLISDGMAAMFNVVCLVQSGSWSFFVGAGTGVSTFGTVDFSNNLRSSVIVLRTSSTTVDMRFGG